VVVLAKKSCGRSQCIDCSYIRMRLLESVRRICGGAG
jgi:hypothetical protein